MDELLREFNGFWDAFQYYDALNSDDYWREFWTERFVARAPMGVISYYRGT